MPGLQPSPTQPGECLAPVSYGVNRAEIMNEKLKTILKQGLANSSTQDPSEPQILRVSEHKSPSTQDNDGLRFEGFRFEGLWLKFLVPYLVSSLHT